MFDRVAETSTPIGVYCNSAKAEAAFKPCEGALADVGGMGYGAWIKILVKIAIDFICGGGKFGYLSNYYVERYLRESFALRITLS